MNQRQKSVQVNLEEKSGTDLLSGKYLRKKVLLPGYGAVVCRLESESKNQIR